MIRLVLNLRQLDVCIIYNYRLIIKTPCYQRWRRLLARVPCYLRSLNAYISVYMFVYFIFFLDRSVFFNLLIWVIFHAKSRVLGTYDLGVLPRPYRSRL